MSTYPPDGPLDPATPIFDEAVAVTGTTGAGFGTAYETGPDSKTGQVKDQAKQTAGQAKETVQRTAADAKDQAADVAATAKDAGAQVASTTKEQAQRVVGDTVDQARQLYGQATTELSSQASKQQDRLGQGLRTFGSDLEKMGSGQQVDSGPASELVQNLAQRAHRVAEWLESRSPEEVLYDVRQYAARRPGVFIALAAVSGVVAARLTKALVADSKADSGPTTGYGAGGSSYVGGYGSEYTTGAIVDGGAVVPETTGAYGTEYVAGETYVAGDTAVVDEVDVVTEYGTEARPANEYGTGSGFGGTR
ncbi:hypothetical protein [Amnibacterium sp.]|uniref:hypothetical protein n=1 Tax=Amnibacterium sp. TaxID=1872496 RepID=UPI00262D359E|nr:hypothetical protein [Amnibacterium sp.]MCU1474959.1 hypothetical protein [Amnibacterium sp.]